MRKNLLLSILCSGVVVVSSFAWCQVRKATQQTKPAAKLQRLDVNPGLWETTQTITSSGEMPIPAGLMDKLTPAQKARMQARMRSRPGNAPMTRTYRTCETAEKLSQTPFADKQNCSEKVVSSSSKQADLDISCELEGIRASGNLKAQVLDREHVKGSGEMTASSNGRTMKSTASFTSRWIGASCGNVK